MVSQTARNLRNNPTEAERKLWSHLRRKQLEGYRFRRQRPIGPYVVDFVCLEANLVIEVDGGQHAEQVERDNARTRFLEKQALRVVRFWNNEVLSNIEGALEIILLVLRDTPNGRS